MPETEARKTVHEIPLGDTFSVRGSEFQVDVADAFFAFDDIRRALPVGASDKDYLLQIGEWLKSNHGPDLTVGELDTFVDLVLVEYNRKKKVRNEVIVSMSMLPKPTESTPSD